MDAPLRRKGQIQWDKGLPELPQRGRHETVPAGRHFRQAVKLNNGSTVVVDEAYLRESMMQPGAKVVEGFENIMPTFQGLLRENEIRGLVAYIKSLQ